MAARTAADLATSTGSELHLVYVGRVYIVSADEEMLRSEYEQLENEWQSLLDEQVSGIEENGATVTQGHLRMGRREDEEILRLAEEIEAGLIVIGSRGLGGVRRALMGSVSDSVVRYAHCPVLVVRLEREAEHEADFLT